VDFPIRFGYALEEVDEFHQSRTIYPRKKAFLPFQYFSLLPSLSQPAPVGDNSDDIAADNHAAVPLLLPAVLMFLATCDPRMQRDVVYDFQIVKDILSPIPQEVVEVKRRKEMMSLDDGEMILIQNLSLLLASAVSFAHAQHAMP